MMVDQMLARPSHPTREADELLLLQTLVKICPPDRPTITISQAARAMAAVSRKFQDERAMHDYVSELLYSLHKARYLTRDRKPVAGRVKGNGKPMRLTIYAPTQLGRKHAISA